MDPFVALDRELRRLEDAVLPEWRALGRLEARVALHGAASHSASVRARSLRIGMNTLRRRWWDFDSPDGFGAMLGAALLALDGQHGSLVNDAAELVPGFIRSRSEADAATWRAWLGPALAGDGCRVAQAAAGDTAFAAELSQWALTVLEQQLDQGRYTLLWRSWLVDVDDDDTPWWVEVLWQTTGRLGAGYHTDRPADAGLLVPYALGQILERVERAGRVLLAGPDAELGVGDVLALAAEDRAATELR